MSSKVVFIHDHKFKVSKDNNFFSEGKITKTTLSRYFLIGDMVTVIGRRERILDTERMNYTLCSADNIIFRPLKGKSWVSIFVLNFCKNFFLLFREIKNSRIVVLRVPSISTLPVFPLLLVTGKPYVVEVVGDAGESLTQVMRESFISKVLVGIFKGITKSMIMNALGAVYVTRVTLQNKYPCPGHVAHASNVEIEPVDKIVLSRRLKRDLMKKEKISIGVIGSYYNNYKGIDIAIKAMGLLTKEFPNIKLHVLGSGNQGLFEKLIEELDLREVVYFDDSRPKQEVLGWIDGIDIYCQPSRTEGLPRSLIEAMSRGCPAVATNVGGIPELLSSEYMVSPDNILGFCDILREIIKNNNFRDGASIENFSKASEYYHDVLASRRDEFFSKIDSIMKFQKKK